MITSKYTISVDCSAYLTGLLYIVVTPAPWQNCISTNTLDRIIMHNQFTIEYTLCIAIATIWSTLFTLYLAFGMHRKECKMNAILQD